MLYQWKAFWVDLEPTERSEQTGNRSAMVISSEEITQFLLIIASITLTAARENRRVYLTEVYLPSDKTGLPKDSIAI